MPFIQAPVMEHVMNVFRPFSGVANILQAQFGWARPPRCRLDHGRMEITVRGAQLTSQNIETNVMLAQHIASAARPQLFALANGDRRKTRVALRAICIIFEDEAIVGGGIANVRFSYVAPPPPGVDEDEGRWRRRGR